MRQLEKDGGLKPGLTRLLGERERESERTGASRNKTRSEINQTGTHCCELGFLNVKLLIPVPKVQKKRKKKKKHRDYFAYILYSVLMLVHCY